MLYCRPLIEFNVFDEWCEANALGSSVQATECHASTRPWITDCPQ